MTSAASTRPRVVVLDIGGQRSNAVVSQAISAAEAGVPTTVISINRRLAVPPGLEVFDLRSLEVKHPVNRIAVTIVGLAQFAKRRRMDRAKSWQRWKASQPYSYLRPWVCWRVTKKHALNQLDLSSTEFLVYSNVMSRPVVWHLMRQYPGLASGYSLPPESIRS